MLRKASILLLLVASLSGCTDALNGVFGPGYDVASTPLSTGDTWNTDNQFRVVVGDPAAPMAVPVRIEATEIDGSRTEKAEGLGDVTLSIPDGVWSVTYHIDGRKWNTHSPVRVDTLPPAPEGLERIVDAQPGGSHTIGATATVEPGASVQVIDLQNGAVLSDSLPYTVTGLREGLQVFLVRITDQAGNTFEQNIQVRVGRAADLPAGQWSFGVVARYTNEARLWDLARIGEYYGPAEAQAATGGTFMSSGHGITPGHPEVQRVVREVVTQDMNTAERALALYKWMFENLEYDETRLATDTLLMPHQVLLDAEDPSDDDRGDAPDDGDGLVRDGPGNGVPGGICRDLAATYVSLLRAAGVPARLVSGYLGGEVDGFHAWIEFYGGPIAGQDPWIPVDVSAIDGPYRADAMLQSFAIKRADYLSLRTVPEDGEVQGWSTALSMHYTWPPKAAEPQIAFRKEVTPMEINEKQIMCVHETTFARKFVQEASQCPGGTYTGLLHDVLRFTERTIDYGIEVTSAPDDAKISAEVAYPFPASIHPDTVAFAFYGPAFIKDNTAGKAISEFTPRDL